MAAPLPSLRRLPWPHVASVDLATEFPWLILHQNATDEHEPSDAGAQDDPSRPCHSPARSPTKTTLTHATRHGIAVYAQPLGVPRSPPTMLSPAQRAARTMLKLHNVLDRRDEDARLRSARDAAMATATVSVQPPRRTQQLLPSSSPEKTGGGVVKPKTTTKKRTTRPTVEVAGSPQARLQQWLARQKTPNEVDNDAPLTQYVSTEMKTRIHRKMHATLGNGLWADEVASPIAAELSSESVFGGYVATRRLAFVPQSPEKSTEHAMTTSDTTTSDTTRIEDATVVPLPAPSEPAVPLPLAVAQPTTHSRSIVEQFADDVRDEAHALVATGSVTDALATLQRGIDRVLHDFQPNADDLGAHGFDYSCHAHDMARRLQRLYRRRHGVRVTCLVRIQRLWRRTRRRRVVLADHAWHTRAATVLQRVYKAHFQKRRRERSAMRLQRCFRTFQSQKLLVWLHRACHEVVAELRRRRHQKRRLVGRLVVVSTMLRVLATRRRAVVRLQSQWRGACARTQYALVQAQTVEAELQRCRREDAFVALRLEQARAALRTFYRTTTRGRQFVDWKRRAPWLRWRRLRAGKGTRTVASDPEATVALRAMFAQRDGNRYAGGNKDADHDNGNDRDADDAFAGLSGLETQCVDAVLGRTHRSDAAQPMAVTTSVTRTRDGGRLTQWRQRATTLWTTWQKKWQTQWQTRCQTPWHAALWTLVVYPKLVLETSTLFRARRRRANDRAVASLVDDHDRVLRARLRRMFRDGEHETPTYTCAWCGVGAATAKLFYAHRNAPHIGCAELERRAAHERAAIAADVAHQDRFRNRVRFWFRFQRAQNRSATVLVPATTFSADAAYVRRVAARPRRFWNQRALRCLVEAAQCCDPDIDAASSSAVVPTELMAQLVWLLDATSGHSLERLHAITHCTIQSNSGGWTYVDDAARWLGLTATHDTPQWSAWWARTWQRLQSKWTTRRSVAGRRYGMGPQRDRAISTGASWRRGVLARVAALA